MRRVAALVAASLLVSSCGADDAEPPREAVTVFAPYRGVEAERFVADLDEWAGARGIDIRFTGTASLATDLEYRVANAEPPDIAIVPQPGLIASLFRDGHVRPLAAPVRTASAAAYDEIWLALGRVDGTQVGLPFRTSPKSLVWYRPSVLAGLGLAPPATLDELERLVQEIEDGGTAPWCIGIEAQRSTGWVATDWVEDLVVRAADGPELYDGWVAGTVEFSDARIASAFARFRDLAARPRRVAGGISGLLTTAVQRAHEPLFAEPPGCVLYRQASFALSWMPPGTTVGPDGDVAAFVLPGRRATDEPPLVVGTDFAVAFSDDSEVDAVMTYLATPDAVRTWIDAGGFTSPLRSVRPEDYPRAADRAVAAHLATAETVVVDASDAMPPEIGTRLFWDEITKWLARTITYPELAATLDAARSG